MPSLSGCLSNKLAITGRRIPVNSTLMLFFWCVCVCREEWGTAVRAPCAFGVFAYPSPSCWWETKWETIMRSVQATNKTKLKGLNMTVNLTSSSLQCPSYRGTILKRLFNSHYSLLIWHREAQTDSETDRKAERKQWHYLLFGRHRDCTLGFLVNAFYCSFIIQCSLNWGRAMKYLHWGSGGSLACLVVCHVWGSGVWRKETCSRRAYVWSESAWLMLSAMNQSGWV